MTVPVPSTPPPPRDFLTEYSLGRHLGKGAFGEVLECTHNATGRQFACKRIDKRLITSESDAAEVRKEVAILQQLTAAGPSRHGGIVQLVEALEDGAAVYLVMELCEGGDLFELIKSDHAAGMPEDMAREIFRQVALAVAYCHARGVLHRDIKPENILFTGPNQSAPAADSCAEFGAEFGAAECSQEDSEDYSAAAWRWRVRVADFGLALFLPHGQMGHGMAGSRFYTAPEMVRGRKYGKRADVWSMGVVLCAMLTGRVPFAGKDRADAEGLRRSILRGAINFSAPAWAPVSTGARDLVRRMLEVDPRRRLKAAEVLQHPWVLGLELPDLTAGDAAADVMSADPAGSGEKPPLGSATERFNKVWQQQDRPQQLPTCHPTTPPPPSPVCTALKTPFPLCGNAPPLAPQQPLNLPAPAVSFSGCPSFNSPCPSQSSASQSTPPSSASRSSPSRSSPPPLSSSLSPSLSNSTATSASTFTRMEAADMDDCGMADGASGVDGMAADGMAGDASLSIPLSLCPPPIAVCRKKSRREEYEEAFVPGSPCYSPEQVFDVVAGVEHYSAFLPWCVGSHVLWRAPDGMEAELEIGFHMLREKLALQTRAVLTWEFLPGSSLSGHESLPPSGQPLGVLVWPPLRLKPLLIAFLNALLLTSPSFLQARSADMGRFHHLVNHWEFAPGRLPGSNPSSLPFVSLFLPAPPSGAFSGHGALPPSGQPLGVLPCAQTPRPISHFSCTCALLLTSPPFSQAHSADTGLFHHLDNHWEFIPPSGHPQGVRPNAQNRPLVPLPYQARSADTGLFHHLDNHWEFAPGRLPGSCLLSFSVDFQFRSLLYTQVCSTPRWALHPGVLYTQVCSTPRCALHPGVLYTQVCSTPRCALHPGVLYIQVGSTPRCALHPGVLYTQVGSTPRWALHPGGLYTQVGSTPRWALHPGGRYTQVGSTPRWAGL
ncbi:unnamed protein product [Closterium sp. NIES-65]|nr:unnamed protein product [Closterium sp. NIES-65]